MGYVTFYDNKMISNPIPLVWTNTPQKPWFFVVFGMKSITHFGLSPMVLQTTHLSNLWRYNWESSPKVPPFNGL
jgi:hypothetical protein